jgi:hypothetical protein
VPGDQGGEERPDERLRAARRIFEAVRELIDAPTLFAKTSKAGTGAGAFQFGLFAACYVPFFDFN